MRFWARSSHCLQRLIATNLRLRKLVTSAPVANLLPQYNLRPHLQVHHSTSNVSNYWK